MVISLLLALLLGCISGTVGYWLRHNTKLSVVEVSAWLTLVSGLILPKIFTEGYLFALVCTCISYAVMTTRKRIANYGEMLIVSFFCTLIVYFGQNVLVGVGGRLGSFAGIAVLSLLVLKSPMKGKEKYDQTNSNSETKTKRDVG